MSDWFYSPAVENAVIVLVTIPCRDDENEPDEEQDTFPPPSWSESSSLVQEILAEGVGTPYLFFDPPAAEDSMEAILTQEDPNLQVKVGIAAQPFGPLSARINGCLRRIFSRNETKRAVAVMGDSDAAHCEMVRQAANALETRCDVVLGATADGQVTLFGTKTYLPDLLDGLSLSARSTDPEFEHKGLPELLCRLRKQGLRHELLPIITE